MANLDDRLIENLMQHRILVLGQQVDDDIGRRLTSQLLLLAAEDPRADITMLINSPGGVVSAGLGIYDTMRMIDNDVATVATGLAASMGQFLLSAGTPGKRYAQPHARILMHQGSAGLQGSPIDIAIQAENLEHTNRVMTELTAEHTGQSIETIHRDSDRDRWFTADEALAYGFVDAIVDGPGVLALGVPRRRVGVLA
ncbi:ClpP family protease [Pseudactinotalea terrae]|uniref:ClpP family protease n=1 Tax=Pseudactinotalea terrae TaxID=1743262 RepID=UPI0012E10EE2|nr:ATP-dependent Clp protease proteolytic subunit [Pseudactinotalea terrae]